MEPAGGEATAKRSGSEASKDAQLRSAVAAWVADDDESAGSPSESGSGAEPGREPKSEEPEKPEEAEAQSEGPEKPEAGKSAPKTDPEPKRDSEPEPEPGAESEPEAGSGTGSGEEEAAAGTPRVPRSREEATPGTEEAASREEAAEASEEAAAGTSEAAGGKRGIDQPTAVFKTPRRPQVDQPTTALKLPPRAAEAKTGRTAEPTGEPDSTGSSGPTGSGTPSAGRTSKFVPLRSDDVRPSASAPSRTPDASGGSGAATGRVGPTATPDAGTAGPAAGYVEAERTRQQPMPPKPPLDLLAELTNTPPPPETPVRTAVRRVKIWTPLVLLALIIFAVAQTVRPLPEPTLELTAQQTFDFQGSKPSLPWPDEGQGYMAATGLGTVGSFGEQEAVPIGSVAKAMTAYIVLKAHPLKRGEAGPAIEVDAKAETEGKLDSVGESTLNTIKAGDTLTEQEALTAIMVPSANNIARLLARWDSGSEEAFVKKMNETAEELGMKNTTYTDPSGLNATTVSTAEDQVKLGQKLVEIPALMDITKLPSWTDPSGKYHRNYNTLVPYDGALGIKTGTTTKAGGNLLFAAHKKVGDTDQLIVGAILGQHKPSIIDTVNAVSKEVMVATQDLLESRTVVKKGQVVGVVDDGFGHRTDVVVAEDVKAVGWPGLTIKLELTDDGKTIPNAAAEGTRVGTMTVGEGASQVKVAVKLGAALAEPSFGDKLTRVS